MASPELLAPLKRVTSKLVDARTELVRHEGYCFRLAKRSRDRQEVRGLSVLHGSLENGLLCPVRASLC